MASSNINPRTYIYTTDTVPNTGQTEYSFTATEPLICDILIVAGGGAGGIYGGGGGAGGLIYLTDLKISSGNYIVKVGKGGAIGNNGSNSSFDTHIAIGGGKGSDGRNDDGLVGGSGGGGHTYEVDGENRTYYSPTDGGQGTLKQGNSSGGGGGAGAIGQNGLDSGMGGNGGIGKQYDITGTPTYYAGGGGGRGENSGENSQLRASGGLGGGGLGGFGYYGYGGIKGDNGVPNTGGGGGGGTNGSSGGSGIVIIKYKVYQEDCEKNSNLFNTAKCQLYCTNIPDNCNASFKEFCNKTENKQACLDFCNKTENKEACLNIITTNCKDKQITDIFCQNTALLVPIPVTSSVSAPVTSPITSSGTSPVSGTSPGTSSSPSPSPSPAPAPASPQSPSTPVPAPAPASESILKNYRLLGLIGLLGLLFIFLIIYIWRN
jgi:hypothetical protein